MKLFSVEIRLLYQYIIRFVYHPHQYYSYLINHHTDRKLKSRAVHYNKNSKGVFLYRIIKKSVATDLEK